MLRGCSGCKRGVRANIHLRFADDDSKLSKYSDSVEDASNEERLRMQKHKQLLRSKHGLATFNPLFAPKFLQMAEKTKCGKGAKRKSEMPKGEGGGIVE